MEYKIIEERVLSSDGKNNIYVKIYEPQTETFTGAVQTVHGMTEYIQRYDGFMSMAAEKGYLCFGHDHVGHGYTAPDDSELGFIASEKGDEVLVNDTEVVWKFIKEKYNLEKRFLLGHSMGSFVTRLDALLYPEDLKGYICMGTGGSNPAALVGLSLAKTIKKLKGERHVSEFITKLMFGTYNKRTEQITKNDWLTKDPEVIKAYAADKYCTFPFTISADIDLVNLLVKSNLQEWYDGLKKDLPIYIVSGSEDPVGDYGKGPTEVYNKLKNSGHTDVTLRLWENDRHEVLNELDKDQVKAEIFAWIDEKNV